MLSHLSVGSATCASQARLRNCLEESQTLDPPTASADDTPTWSEAPSWCAAGDVLPIRLEKPGDIRSPMQPIESCTSLMFCQIYT